MAGTRNPKEPKSLTTHDIPPFEKGEEKEAREALSQDSMPDLPDEEDDTDIIINPDDGAAPDDYSDLTISGPQNWIRVRKGMIIQGMLLARYTKRGGRSKGTYFYVIQITRPVRAYRKNETDDEMHAVMVAPGQTVCIDEKKDLEELNQLIQKVERGAKYSVWIRPLEKKPLASGNDFWTFQKLFKCLTPPTR